MPRYRNVPIALTSAGSEAVELAASAGLILDPWQADVLEGALGERADGKWSAFEVGVIVPRQNGKGSILEARELAGLFLFGERLILHSAHEFKTAQEAFRRILFLVQSNPDLDKRVQRVRTSHGEEGIELRSGQRLRFIARSTGSGRGFTGDTIILDEAYNLSGEAMAALLPTMSARPNPQLWYTSSAPLPTPVSEVLRKFCRRGRAGTSRSLAYFEWCAAKDCDLDDPAAWADANPAMGLRIPEEFVENERSALGDEFPRERLGIWDDSEGGGGVIDAGAWAACKNDKSGVVGAESFALAISPSRDWASFGAAGAGGLGGVHVELVDRRPGTQWVVDRAKRLQETWPRSVLAIALGSPAASFLPALEQAGVHVLEVSTADHAKASGNFYDAVVQGALRHLGQPELTIAVDGADRRFLGETWLWSMRLSTVDISPLDAVTLAKWAHDQHQPVMGAPGAVLL